MPLLATLGLGRALALRRRGLWCRRGRSHRCGRWRRAGRGRLGRCLNRRRGRPLRLLAGPERIETGWWDEHPVQRDYFIAEAHDGALVWVFRHRLPQPPGEPVWFLQGLFG